MRTTACVQQKLKYGYKTVKETPRKNRKIRRPANMWQDDNELQLGARHREGLGKIRFANNKIKCCNKMFCVFL
jgi:CRISPR/Cas system CSM-associated protein Csm3 (group 7 of RAMP superfamily)